MIVYEATKKQFLHVHDNEDIEDVILAHYTAKTGKRVGRSEMESWRGSLGYMAKVLRDEGVPDDAGLAIELHLPQSSKRIDFTLTGHGEAGQKMPFSSSSSNGAHRGCLRKTPSSSPR